MNINSQSSFFPPQPDNPSRTERHFLTQYALNQRGRPEDIGNIYKLMSPPVDITSIVSPGSLKGIKVAVIGAGLAGLSAAFELRKTGAHITVFEAESRIGGRVYTYHFDKNPSLYGELGSMRIPVSHETVWYYINLFKLQTRPFIQYNENTFLYLKNTRVRNDAKGLNVMTYIYPKYRLKDWEKTTPWQQLAYYGLESPMLLADANQRSELLQVKPFYNQFIRLWDYQSIRKTLESSELSQAGIDLISNLSPLAGQNLYNSYVDISEANYPANLSYLYEIPGGTSRLPYAFYNSLINKNPATDYPGIAAKYLGEVSIKMESWITGIHRGPDSNKVILDYGNKDKKSGNTGVFDYVICSIPFSTLRNVDIRPQFSNLKMQAIKEVNYIDAMKFVLLSKRRFWEEGGASGRIIGGGSFTDLPITSVWYPSDHAQYYKNQTAANSNLAAESGVFIASYSYNLDPIRLANMEPEVRLNEIKRDVEQVHGLPRGYLDDLILDYKMLDWNMEPWERGALCFFTPQQKSLFSYGMALPEYDSRVFMAGDHISAVHRWMQGALQSGMYAANSLAAACLLAL